MATTLSGATGSPALVTNSGLQSPAPFIVDNTAAAAGAVTIPAGYSVVDVSATIPATVSGAVSSSSGSDTVAPLSSNITVNGGAATLVFVGGSGAPSVDGSTGNVTLFGGAAVFGGSGDSSLSAGGSMSEVLYAGAGNQTLSGSTSAANNLFYAGAGQDSINLGAGNNTVFAGAGSATVVGGGGQNTYEFLASLTGKNASITIGDFHVGSDRLVISGYGTSEDTVFNSKSVSSGSTVLTLGDGTKVVLTGVTDLNRSNLT